MIKSSIEQIFHRFEQQKALIIGDVMIDSYIFGHVDRISPEAPVPVVAVKERTHRLGGAANVALNIKALGAQPILCSVIGNDDKGEIFLELLKKREMSSKGIVQSEDRITTTKFRIIGNATQMLRVDEEIDTALSNKDETLLLENIQYIIANNSIDVIIFQDYDKGVIGKNLIGKIVALAGDIPTVVDPKKRNFHDYNNVSLFKPNLKELREGINEDFEATNQEKLHQAIEEMQDKIECKYFFTTLSEHGVVISEKKNKDTFVHHHIPAQKRNIADVSGAGDTVISIAALCLAQGLPAVEIAGLSNMAGGLVCEEVGVVPINKEKLFKELSK